MKSIVLTDHIMKQVKLRKKLVWARAKIFLRNKFSTMLENEESVILTFTVGGTGLIVYWSMLKCHCPKYNPLQDIWLTKWLNIT